MIEIQIAVNPNIISADDLREYLISQELWPEVGASLEAKKSSLKFRGLDPTILVALIGALGTGFGALLTGLLQIAQKSAEKKIILQTKDGERLEIPADTPHEKIEQLIATLKQLDDQDIKIAIP